MLSGARGGVIGSTGGLSGAAVPAPLGLCAAVAFGSPEAASCGLTLTNTAQELRLGGCKLFSSSREKSSRRRAGGVWAAAPCHVPPPSTAVPGPCCHRHPRGASVRPRAGCWGGQRAQIRAVGCACTSPAMRGDVLSPSLLQDCSSLLGAGLGRRLSHKHDSEPCAGAIPKLAGS